MGNLFKGILGIWSVKGIGESLYEPESYNTKILSGVEALYIQVIIPR